MGLEPWMRGCQSCEEPGHCEGAPGRQEAKTGAAQNSSIVEIASERSILSAWNLSRVPPNSLFHITQDSAQMSLLREDFLDHSI